MASLRRMLALETPADRVWDAVRDFGAVHRRVAPGFVINCVLEGDTRIVTFSNGTVARELLVDVDDDQRRLAYAVKSERVHHYNASLQVAANGADSCRLVWIVDVLPSEIAAYIGGQMDEALLVMQTALASK